MPLHLLGLLAAAGIFLLTGCRASSPVVRGLEITYDSRGLEQLSYRGVVLEDLQQNPDDVFHIWHMKATGLQVEPLTKDQALKGQYQWGGVNTARSWDSAKHTWKYFFDWGTIAVEFAQSADTLNINVTEVNNPDSQIIFQGATVYPFVLHFPRLPENFNNPTFAHLSANKADEPETARTISADYGEGQIASFVAGPAGPLYHGFDPLSSNATWSAFNYVPIISSTAMDSMPSFLPHIDRPVLPGREDHFMVSLRFAPSATSVRAPR